MERRAVLQSLLVLAGVAWAGNSPAQPHSPKLIRINIPGPHLLPFLPIELIPRLGYDRALGVQLAIRYMPSGVQALENVLAGDAAFAGVGFSVMPNFAVQGKPVVALATLSSGTPPYAVSSEMIWPEQFEASKTSGGAASASHWAVRPPKPIFRH